MQRQKIIIVGLVIITILMGAIIVTQNKSKSFQMEGMDMSSTKGQGESMMMEGKSNTGGSMSMEGMPCHKMGNGQWMGDCEKDANGKVIEPAQ